MLELKQEYIEDFINYPVGMAGKSILCRNILLFHFVTTIPTAIFGSASGVTKIILLPLWIILSLWGFSLYAGAGIDKKVISYYLYIGCSSVFFSMVLLLAAYKVYLMISTVSPAIIICMIVAHIVIAVLISKRILHNIKNGAYTMSVSSKPNNNMVLIIGIWALLVVARVFLGHFKNEQEIYVSLLTFLLVFYSYILLYGINFIFRYYFMRMLMARPVTM